MQRFPCPFCGLRDEREFHYAGEAGNQRPEPAAEVSADRWADYLYNQTNAKGTVREIWTHLTCQEMFLMTRHSVSMDVVGAEALRKERP